MLTREAGRAAGQAGPGPDLREFPGKNWYGMKQFCKQNPRHTRLMGVCGRHDGVNADAGGIPVGIVYRSAEWRPDEARKSMETGDILAWHEFC